MKTILKQEQDKALTGIIQKIAGRAWYQYLVDETPDEVKEFDLDMEVKNRDEELTAKKKQYDADLKDLEGINLGIISDVYSYKGIMNCEEELKDLLK